MNILIIGFQRSGTTLLRRILQSHPHVDKIFHESFLLSKYPNNKDVIKFGAGRKTWGEKVPYYPNIRKIPIKTYCERWNECFGNNSRILHIIRNPYDVALSNVKKFSYIKTIDHPMNLYKRAVPNAVKNTTDMKSVFTFKYEDLLLNQDKILHDICKHCGLKTKVNFRKLMKGWENPRYQRIDPSRAFAYLEQKIKWDKYDLQNEIDFLNTIGEAKYK